MTERHYAVNGDESRVEGWSTIRLPFEPKGWLGGYRTELRRALRSMKPTDRSNLYAEYAAPEPAFVDLENVLLYNVGSGCYSHLAQNGIICRRTVSNDGLHHVTYTGTRISENILPDGNVIARAQLASMPAGTTTAHWWACFREQLEVYPSQPYNGEFGVVAEAGSAWRHGLAPAVKSLLDGLVAALHVHDRSHPNHVSAALSALGDGERLWGLLNDPQIAIFGQRRLVHPHGQKIAWSPADERCGYFALVRSARQEALTVAVVAL